MAAQFDDRSDAAAIQLESLRRERLCYVIRLAELMRRTDSQTEVLGYLRYIENVNEACIRLAQTVGQRPLQNHKQSGVSDHLFAA